MSTPDDSREPASFPSMPDPEGDVGDEPSWGNCRKCRRLGRLYPVGHVGCDEVCSACRETPSWPPQRA